MFKFHIFGFFNYAGLKSGPEIIGTSPPSPPPPSEINFIHSVIRYILSCTFLRSFYPLPLTVFLFFYFFPYLFLPLNIFSLKRHWPRWGCVHFPICPCNADATMEWSSFSQTFNHVWIFAERREISANHRTAHRVYAVKKKNWKMFVTFFLS
jgi:hypothetical protein